MTALGHASVEIRPLSIDDLDLFRAVRVEALQKHPETFGSPEEEEGGEAAVAAYRHWLTGTIVGAFERKALVGIAGFYVSRDKRSWHRGHIFTVYVREANRGKGVGDRLIKDLLALAERRVDQVHLAVLISAADAINIYKRNGFKIYGIDPCVIRIGDARYDKYLMIRKFR